MKIYEYTRCWGWRMYDAEQVKGELYALLLDCPYFFSSIDQESSTYLIPPFNVVNEYLKTGGNDGVMSPGNIWESFEISEEEYENLVDKLLNLNLKELKKEHIYAPSKFIIDTELNNKFTIPSEWEKQHILKYLGVHEFIQFYDDETTLLLNNNEIGKIEIFGTAGGPRYFGRIIDTKEIVETIKNEQVDVNKLTLISEWFDDKEMLYSKNWFKPKNNLKFYVTDSWGRIPKVIEIYIAENNFIAFKTEFEEIKPTC